MLRVWHSQSSMGVCLIWDLDLSRVQWETQGAGGTPLLRQVCMQMWIRMFNMDQITVEGHHCLYALFGPSSHILSCTPVILCRSVTMDKWKELELNKMKSGGNNKAKEFLEGQSDWKAGGNISANYNSKAAALYRDKVVIMPCLKVY